MLEVFCTLEEIAGLLDGWWAIHAREARSPTATASGGAEVTICDTVLVFYPASCRKPAGLTPGTRPAVPVQ